jgi:hypothetical protein
LSTYLVHPAGNLHLSLESQPINLEFYVKELQLIAFLF